MIPAIRVTNSLSGKKEQLVPVESGKIKIYACGVTVYDHCHIGHAMQAIYFEMIRTYLEYTGYQVTYVRNYTDVEDKIINRASELGISPRQLADQMITSAEEDLQALGIRQPDFAPLVSKTIPEIIAMIEVLIAKGAAYLTDEGDVYYRVKSKPDYGKLSNRNPDELRHGTRTIIQGQKEDDLDFVLWKSGEVEGTCWPSPWGSGRPGWHIECSAMAKKYLGDTLDIHGGGRDLIFPHHENEIAQSESANRCTFARYWLHSGLLTIDHQKMSKSLGNHILIKDFLREWPAEVLKLAFFQRCYGSNVNFSRDEFSKSRGRLLYYYSTLTALDELASSADPKGQILKGFETQPLIEEFHNAMTNDFNTTLALAGLNKVFHKANELLQSRNSSEKRSTARSLAITLRELFAVMNLLTLNPKEFIANIKNQILPELGITGSEIETIIAQRKAAREKKDFAKADEIREQLLKKGIDLRDGAGGTEWSIRFDERT